MFKASNFNIFESISEKTQFDGQYMSQLYLFVLFNFFWIYHVTAILIS